MFGHAVGLEHGDHGAGAAARKMAAAKAADNAGAGDGVEDFHDVSAEAGLSACTGLYTVTMPRCLLFRVCARRSSTPAAAIPIAAC